MKLHLSSALPILQKLPANSVDLVLTDPPYLQSYRTRHRGSKEKGWGAFGIFREYHGDKNTLENQTEILTVLAECKRCMKDDTAIYLFCGETSLEFYLPIMSRLFTYRNLIVWKKNNWTAGNLKNAFGRQTELIIFANKGKAPIIGKRHSNVWECPRIASSKLIHPQQKPVELLEKAVLASSQIGNVVLDPFMGCGSVGVACKNTKRNFIGIDIDEECVQNAAQRLNTGYYTNGNSYIVGIPAGSNVSSSK